MNSSLNLKKDLMQNTSPFFNNSPTSPYNWLTKNRVQIFKTGFRKLLILWKFWEWCKCQRVGNHLVCVIMTYCMRKSICDSPLTGRYELFQQRCFLLKYLNFILKFSKLFVSKTFNSILHYGDLNRPNLEAITLRHYLIQNQIIAFAQNA